MRLSNRRSSQSRADLRQLAYEGRAKVFLALGMVKANLKVHKLSYSTSIHTKERRTSLRDELILSGSKEVATTFHATNACVVPFNPVEYVPFRRTPSLVGLNPDARNSTAFPFASKAQKPRPPSAASPQAFEA
jgi:hypothetical protein